jgi:hypothetical protein
MHPNFQLSYGILVRKYKNVTITLKIRTRKSIKNQFLIFKPRIKTTLQHHCTTVGFASGYTEVLQGGAISMPTGRDVDNL